MHLAANPLWILLHSWRPAPFRAFVRDTVVNVALYIPLSFTAHLVFRNKRKGPEAPFCASRFDGLPGFGIYGPVLLGLLLSTAVELTQLLEPVRNTNIADVITNVIGSAFGVMAGLLFETLAPRNGSRGLGRILDGAVADRGALTLVFCWAAWLLFPLFPVLSPYELSRKFAVFEHSRLLDPVLLISAAASWLAAGLLLTAAGARVSRRWFTLTLLAVPAQFFITERQPTPSLLLGATAGVVLFSVYRRAGTPAKVPTQVAGWVFLAAIVVRGLAPFHFVTAPQEFNWIPFVATLLGDWQSSAGVLIEKVFYYGTAIWLLRAAGLKLMHSVALVATVLASIEIVQMHLPGRTPEITDPILAILMGFVLAMLSPPARGFSGRKQLRA